MNGVSKELQNKYKEILNENIPIDQKVKKVHKNKSYLSLNQLANIFNRSITWYNKQLKK